ncbi:unnamed protein product, partial [Rotaria sp. Silwood2]
MTTENITVEKKDCDNNLQENRNDSIEYLSSPLSDINHTYSELRNNEVILTT